MIGVFDSGIGGLTVVRALMARLPGFDITYFGDTARTPYGSKSRRTVIGYAVENTEFLLAQKARAIVVACNTASSFATDVLRERFQVPIFEVVTPAAEMAVAQTRKGVIGIIGTRATVNSGIYPRVIQSLRPDCRTYTQACPLLVPLVEEGWLQKPETAMIVKKYIRPLKVRQIDTLILGCTHYPLLQELIQAKAGRRVRVIDSSGGVAAAVAAHVRQHAAEAARWSQADAHRFFVSDATPHFETIARGILKRPIRLEHFRP
ncbi:MAG: glutamate racemase [Desulfobacterales bacterium]|nr:glutamate racemase [Desulfobacterales bacterium]MDJ0989111.1 glutamate racemase [Desulfobacterales bacterium]